MLLDRRQLEGVEPVTRFLGESLGRYRAEERLAELADRSFVVVLRRAGAGDARSGRSSGRVGQPRAWMQFGAFPIVLATSAFSRMTGYSEAELYGLSLEALMGPETDRGAVDRILGALKRGERIATEFVAYRKDGARFPLRLDVYPVPASRGAASHFVATPPQGLAGSGAGLVVGALRRAGADPLTALASRLLLDDTLRRALERSAKNSGFRFAVLFIDLDGFKAVNDTFGHIVGDQVLVAVARQLEGAVRPGDTVARFGGDEFVILLEVVQGVQELLAVAERVRECIEQPIRLPEREISITASIGIALSETGHRSVEEILKEADAAMYLAKQAGGDRYRIFDLALQEAAMATQQIRSALKMSLERGEFRLHYQPMVDLASGEIVGFEALLRWYHPERGVLPAAEFIGDADDMGLIVPLGRWVIHEACRQITAWRNELPRGTSLVLSVNASTRELLDPSLPERLRESLQETEANPRSLRLEIPEGFLARPQSESRDVLQPLLDLGIRTGIGDFGRGYSSLGLLHHLPVDFLKMDRQFVADLSGRRARKAKRARYDQSWPSPTASGSKSLLQAWKTRVRGKCCGGSRAPTSRATSSPSRWTHTARRSCSAGHGGRNPRRGPASPPDSNVSLWLTRARNTLNKSVPGTLDLQGGSSRAERDDRGGGRWSR